MAEEMQLKLQPTMECIRGYAGGATRASGVTDVTLTVDLVTAVVTVFVVADEVQSVPIIIGQSFLNLATLPDIDDLHRGSSPCGQKTLWLYRRILLGSSQLAVQKTLMVRCTWRLQPGRNQVTNTESQGV
jgi:hypothetical protein